MPWAPPAGVYSEDDSLDFHVASQEEIRSGGTTDIYFHRTLQILDRKGWDRKVTAEVTASSLPRGWRWAVLAGIEEASHLLEGRDLDVMAMPEGSIFYPLEPVMRIEGMYSEFCELETPLLGLLCQASGIATAAARCKIAAGFKPVYSFGIRRMHPAISPMIDRSAYIGGSDGISGISGARLVGVNPVGTIPHALMILLGDRKKAWKAFDEVIDPSVPRIMLVDTFSDEVVESLSAAQALGRKLKAVRLDTPSSRRGDMRHIVKEVRWKLDVEGYSDVQILISGGLNEDSLRQLSDVADAFGVGTSISSARTVDFALDIVEVEGRKTSKRGKFSGAKNVFECPKCFRRHLSLEPGPVTCDCGREMVNVLMPLIGRGKAVKLPGPQEIREKVLRGIKARKLDLED